MLVQHAKNFDQPGLDGSVVDDVENYHGSHDAVDGCGSPMELHAGSRLAHFEILGLLGVGGMGEAYRAMDTKLKREVAIKVLPPQFAEQSDRLGRFEQEAVLLASLNHPHIGAIYGVERVDGVPCLVSVVRPIRRRHQTEALTKRRYALFPPEQKGGSNHLSAR